MTAMTLSSVGPSLRGRHFLDFGGYTGADIADWLDLAEDLKARLRRGDSAPRLAGKTLAMVFDKPSTRTRVSFEVGMFQLGGHALYLPGSGSQIGRGEPPEDTARVLSRYVQGIMVRTFSHASLEELARHSEVPVINGLTDLHHPCQALADLMTVRERFGALEGVTLAYVGDGNNMAHSLIEAGARGGMTVKVATPKGYGPDARIVEESLRAAARPGAVQVMEDPYAAVEEADVVYTDVWASMGQEEETEVRRKVFSPYQVTGDLFAAARKGAIFLHCLPAHRGEEVAAEVIDGPRSSVFDQAENRLHAQKAVLLSVMAES